MTPAPGPLALLGQRSEEHARGLPGTEATVDSGPRSDVARTRGSSPLATLLGRAGRWISSGFGIAGDGDASVQTLATEIGATLAIGRRDDDGRIEARCSGRAHLQGTLAAVSRASMEWEREALGRAPDRRRLVSSPERLETCGLSAVPLERDSLFAWLQVLDGRGRPVSDEVFLGHGPDLRFQLHTRLGVAATSVTPGPGGSPARPHLVRRGVEGVWLRLLHGLYARLVLRTYGNSIGARFYVETLMLPLLPAGHAVWLSRRTGRGKVSRPRRRAIAR